MNTKTHPALTLVTLAFGALLLAGANLARADYAGQVMSLNPQRYWKLDVPNTSVAITNLGSAGTGAKASFVSAVNQSAVADLQAGTQPDSRPATP